MKKTLSLLLLIIPFLGISQARFTTGDVLNKTIEIRPIQVTAKTAPNIPIVQLKNANLTVDTLIKALKLNLYNNSMFTGATQANLLYINSLGNNSNSVSTYLNTTSNGRVFLDTLESLTFKGDFVIDSPVYDIDFISPSQAKGEVYRIKLGPLVTQRTFTQGNYTMILRDGDYIYSNGTIWDKLVDNGRISALETSVTNLNSFTNVIWSNLAEKVTQVTGKGLSTNDFTNAYKGKSDSISLKQNRLNGGTGFVKSTGGTISYDNSTYLTSIPAQTFSSLTGKPTTISGYGITDAYSSSNPSGYITSSALSTYATQANLALKANIASPTFTTGATVTGTPSNTIQSGPYIYLNGGSGSSFSTIQQGVGTLDFYGFNGSSWVNNLSINNATGNVGIGVNPFSKLHVGSTTNVSTLITVGNPLGAVMVGHGADNESIISGYSATNIRFGNNYGFGFVETVRFNANGKNGFGTNNPRGIIDVVSTTSPSYPFPRMTTAQRTALTGMDKGAYVFDTDFNHPYYYSGTAWVQQ